MIIGGTLGHAICTGLAVLGGRFIAQRISIKTGTHSHFTQLPTACAKTICESGSPINRCARAQHVKHCLGSNMLQKAIDRRYIQLVGTTFLEGARVVLSVVTRTCAR